MAITVRSGARACQRRSHILLVLWVFIDIALGRMHSVGMSRRVILTRDWCVDVVRPAMGIEPDGAYLSNPAASKRRS